MFWGLDSPTPLPVAMQGELVSRPFARVQGLATCCGLARDEGLKWRFACFAGDDQLRVCTRL